MSKYITGDELRSAVRAEAKKYRSLAEFARSIEVYPSFMGNFLSGEKGPGFKVLERMGYREVTLYEKIRDDENAREEESASSSPVPTERSREPL